MRFSVSSEHLDFLRKHHAIELEALFSSEEIAQLNEGVQAAIKTRGNHKTPNDLFLSGRDLWRDSEQVKKILFQKKFLSVMAQLLDQTIFRIGYDQYFPAVQKLFDGPYADLLKKQEPIDAFSCIQGIVGGAIICLIGNQSDERSLFFPTQAGNVVVFNPLAKIDFSELKKQQECAYLMVTLTKATAVYVYCPADPNASYLRELGYTLSDKLTDKLHPIVYRKEA